MDLREKRFTFRFYYEVDIDKVLNGVPWTFNNHLLILHKLRDGEDPLGVPLFHIVFWVQIHDLPNGMYMEAMAK